LDAASRRRVDVPSRDRDCHLKAALVKISSVCVTHPSGRGESNQHMISRGSFRKLGGVPSYTTSKVFGQFVPGRRLRVFEARHEQIHVQVFGS
jgi:hypothetical protein